MISTPTHKESFLSLIKRASAMIAIKPEVREQNNWTMVSTDSVRGGVNVVKTVPG